jgi:ketosteroid isomerase-like protein
VGESHEEIVRRLIEAIDRRDVPAINALIHPDARIRSRMGSVEGRDYVAGEAEKYLADMDEAWAEVHWSFERVIPTGADTVVAAVHFRGRSRVSGIEVNQMMGNVVSLRDGLVHRLEAHGSLHDGLLAAGVEE